MDSTHYVDLNILSSLHQQNTSFPTQFMWPSEDLPRADQVDQLNDPLIDLGGFLNGDEEATRLAAAQIRAACVKDGVFQVVNHGVDATLIQAVQQHLDAFFGLPLDKKLPVSGYSGAHSHRFSSMLPWKETFTIDYDFSSKVDGNLASRVDYSALQEEADAGFVYQKYCEAMKKLSFVIFELLAISMGVERKYFLEFFEDGSSTMRANHYPPCKEADLTLGTGPHCDSNSITILHQDHVGGLQAFSDGKWRVVRPCPGAFVINIGDTFMALSNGKFKSCLHRAVVNKETTRRSLVFFVNPRDDKVVAPPHQDDLMPRQYPDFTWSDLRKFIQSKYRADGNTLQNFVGSLSLVPDQKTRNLP